MYHHDNTIDEIRNYIRNVYNYFPSKSVVFGWIRRYSELVKAVLANKKPIVGDIWKIVPADIYIRGNKIWILGIFDEKTEYLLSLIAFPVVDSINITNLIQQAIDNADKIPKKIIADDMTECLSISELEFAFGERIQFVFEKLYIGTIKRNFLDHRFT